MKLPGIAENKANEGRERTKQRAEVKGSLAHFRII